MSTLHDTPKRIPLTPLAVFYKILLGVAVIALLYVALRVYLVGLPLFGVCVLGIAIAMALIFGSKRFYTSRFIFPGIAAMILFVVFPIVYTIYIGFTNYSSFNLLSFDRVNEVIRSQNTVDNSSKRPFKLIANGDQYQLFFPEASVGAGFITDSVALDGNSHALASEAVASMNQEPLTTKVVVSLRKALAPITVTLPDGTLLRPAGIRDFATITPEYSQGDGTMTHLASGAIYTADHDTGFYVNEAGEKLTPGWRTFIGVKNFTRIATSDGISDPMIGIFIWTFIFAVLSVLCTFSLGLLLAVVLQWEHLRGKAIYRVLLILPYAVPGFISILVFRGLFNQNFGEINLILEALFNIRPNWFTDSTLARTMIVIVNTWLGYPYMMMLAMGFLQAIPAEQKKAAYIEGAGSIRVFFSLVLPQILPPFLPLLLSSFAFNFNNLVLILLLTRGGPDTPGTLVPAGETDILGSFTYRIAFLDSGTQFGLAGAITLLIFVLVSFIAYANFIAMRKATGAQ